MKNRFALSIFGALITTTVFFFLINDSWRESTSFSENKSIPPAQFLKEKKLRNTFVNTKEEHGDVLKYVHTLPKRNKKNAGVKWYEVGPNDIGGRTRALGIDRRNENIVLAGAATGGVWKTIDDGATWEMVSDLNENHSIMWIEQDPDEADVWYYSTGEFASSGGSSGAELRGSNGIYKSLDNGSNWSYIENQTATPNNQRGLLTLTTKISISPTTGDLFVAAFGFGIVRSKDDGQTYELLLGDWNNGPDHTEMEIDANGRIVAYVSAYEGNTAKQYVSVNNGDDWTEVTPTEYTVEYGRGVMRIAPSNQDLLYVLVSVRDDQNNEFPEFFVFDLKNNTYERRTDNLPGIGIYNYPVAWTGGYDWCIDVKPDDEGFVVLGGQQLWRSKDGFQTPGSRKEGDNISWDLLDEMEEEGDLFGSGDKIHLDQHIVRFAPSNGQIVWSGNDGGVDKIIGVNGVNTKHWVGKNNDYNVTQFYTVSLAQSAGDYRVAGGAQDNSSILIDWQEKGPTVPEKFWLAGGDGTFAYVGDQYYYASGQGIGLTRVGLNRQSFTEIYPKDVYGRRFIVPTIVNPNNEDHVYFVSFANIYRTTIATQFPDRLYGGVDYGWDEMDFESAGSGSDASCLAISTSPADILFVGYSSSYFNEVPKIARLKNASTADASATEFISSPLFPVGAEIEDLVVNDKNAEEFMVVFGGHDIESVFVTSDGGQTFEAIEGNLSGSGGLPGPAMRTGGIVEYNNKTVYLVGTSAGLFSVDKENVNGSSTIWAMEASNTIGAAFISDIDSRSNDGTIAVGTHGRGFFIGLQDPSLSTEEFVKEDKKWSILQNPSNELTINYSGNKTALMELSVYDFAGKQLYKKSSTGSINFEELRRASSQWKQGMYFVNLRVNGKDQQEKFMKIN